MTVPDRTLRKVLVRAGRVLGAALAPYTVVASCGAATTGALLARGSGRFCAQADALPAAARAGAAAHQPYTTLGRANDAAASAAADAVAAKAAGAAGAAAGGVAGAASSLLEQLVGSHNQFAQGGVTLMILGAALAAARTALVYRWVVRSGGPFLVRVGVGVGVGTVCAAALRCS